jgi:hypothetical protein
MAMNTKVSGLIGTDMERQYSKRPQLVKSKDYFMKKIK